MTLKDIKKDIIVISEEGILGEVLSVGQKSALIKWNDTTCPVEHFKKDLKGIQEVPPIWTGCEFLKKTNEKTTE